MKTDLQKILLDDISGFEDIVEYDEVVTLDDAKALFPEWEQFLKRNRIPEDIDAIYIEKIKNDPDMEMLRPAVKKVSTGWVSVSDLSAGQFKTAISASKEENRLTGWDLLSFDEMNEKCSSCKLSWDKGRGCIGAFGPDNSALPEIAMKRGCAIIASVPESAAKRRIFTPEEGAKMAEEVTALEAALPEEGKMFVRRYSGCLERLKAVAEISVREGCGFYFF